MEKRKRKFEDINPIGLLLLREKFQIIKYRKVGTRNRAKKAILLKLAIKKIEEAEKENFIKIGKRKRKVII